MNVTAEQRQALEKYLPWVLVLLGAWLLGRGLKKIFWTLFGLAWAVWWMGGWHGWVS